MKNIFFKSIFAIMVAAISFTVTNASADDAPSGPPPHGKMPKPSQAEIDCMTKKGYSFPPDKNSHPDKDKFMADREACKNTSKSSGSSTDSGASSD